MNKPCFRVVGMDQATCPAEYGSTETATRPASIEMLKLYDPTPETPRPSQAEVVTVRVQDIIQVLQQSVANRMAWVNDFADDPVVISRDLYDVLLTYQRMKRAG